MGLLGINDQDVLVSAVLTKRGRELLFGGMNSRFKITKFALSDDEINYSLFNINASDPGQDIENLSIIEASTNDSTQLKNKLIRFNSNTLENISKSAQFKNIPSNEIQFKTQNTKTTLSVENWNSDVAEISFSLLDPTTQSLFLSNAFTIDFTEFFNTCGMTFNFSQIAPPINYFYDASPSTSLGTIYNIDNSHKNNAINNNSNAINIENFVNSLNIPAITFEISLQESQLKKIFSYLLTNNISSFTSNVLIRNNDNTTIPVTQFYGVNKDFASIATQIPLTISF